MGPQLFAFHTLQSIQQQQIHKQQTKIQQQFNTQQKQQKVIQTSLRLTVCLPDPPSEPCIAQLLAPIGLGIRGDGQTQPRRSNHSTIKK